MKKNWETTWAVRCELRRDRRGAPSPGFPLSRSASPGFMSLFIKLRACTRQSLRHPTHTHSKAHDFTTGLSCVVLRCLDLPDARRSSPSEAYDGARVWTTEKSDQGRFLPVNPPHTTAAGGSSRRVRPQEEQVRS